MMVANGLSCVMIKVPSGCMGMVKRSRAPEAELDALSNWTPGGRGFNPCRGRQHSFVEILLIQEGQLSVSGERMCTILVNCLED